MQATYLGIEIGGTKLQVVAGNEQGQILERLRFIVAPEQGGEGIRAQIQAALPQLLRQFPVQAIGAGFGGPVDCQTGKICCSHHVQGWSDFELGPWLAAQTGKPVFVDNDSNVATLGEALHGAGRGFSAVFYMNMGSGVGGGLVRDGQIYHGAIPGEAEIGHVRLNKKGDTVESRCSGWAVDRRIRLLKRRGLRGPLARLTKDVTRGEACFLSEAIKQGDRAAKEIVQETADNLAFALSHATHLFHPHVIVLGGGLSLIGEPLRKNVENFLPRYVMKAFHPPPPIRLAGLGEDCVPVGALALARLGAAR